jgi:hypothetical protein
VEDTELVTALLEGEGDIVNFATLALLGGIAS